MQKQWDISVWIWCGFVCVQQGVTQTSQLVSIVDFYQGHILPDLQSAESEGPQLTFFFLLCSIYFWNQMHEETSPYLLLGAQDQWLGVEQDQLLCGSTGISSGNCQEMETCMVWACHTQWQLLQNLLLSTLEGGQHRGSAWWTTSKSAHPHPSQSCSQGPPAEKTGRGSLLNRLSCPPYDPNGQGTEMNWTVHSSEWIPLSAEMESVVKPFSPIHYLHIVY